MPIQRQPCAQLVVLHLGTDPQFWMNLQGLYELRVAKERAGKAIKRLPTLEQVSGARTPTR